MNIKNKFEFEVVYLITDPDQFERLITRIIICINGSLLYELSCGNVTSLHYENEISTNKDNLLALGLDNSVNKK